MKNDRLALTLMVLACSAAYPAFGQGALPQCDNANYDQARGLFTVTSPAPNAVNQQCLITVVPTQAFESSAQGPAYLVEGYYAIEMSGGGGGGGGGAAKDGGGGGGGAGAAPFKTIQLLSPGVYKLTLGTGGEGGKPGGWTQAGNPTSLTNFNTGELIAGFQGADVWAQRTQAPGSGLGGVAAAGGSSGGSGGDSGPNSEEMAQSGGMSQTPGYSGMAGQAGGETGRSAEQDGARVVQANAGGGGGASVGSGGDGDSAGRNRVAGFGGVSGVGDLGGGGGGGSGAVNAADTGGRGGHGFIRLALSEPIRQAVAPAPVVVAAAAAPAPEASTVTTPAPAAIRPARKDRN